MGTLAEMTKAPVTWQHGGKEYFISPLVPADLGIVERELRKIPMRQAAGELEAYGDTLTAEERKAIMDDARARAEVLGDIQTEEGAAALNGMEGAQLMLWLSLRKQHPELTIANVQAMITFDNIVEVHRLLDEVSGMTRRDDSEGNSQRGTADVQPDPQPIGSESLS